ncbi:adenylate/guanylate cyclase domain-containing protein [Methylobacterium isbiliense]|uniref:Na(+)-translocating NADH-quinone reductase subunit F n=1 Tax=Methylobacterium isbiliense TaxID=315478 RepID=A0ABQ4SJN7_9HYPH|nr:adenylate/guanylate cyclase domain-containing protein [Methylobacterium isbiliense]MDN3626443.1 adenylate/guanylate cyclase domain-containing protein [Methylobacterium isbiliense]GJE01989.1 Na(+)-translocating NADH-quinone reductase subunit F [Methylobacterium isbiliense]
MTPSPAVQVPPAGLWRGSWRQRARLVSGLVLFAFAGTHFANHALGLVSLDVMRAAEGWRTAVTRSLPGTVVLAGALLVHVALAFESLASRRSLRMPVWQAAQILLGLAIPFLLVPHILGTRVTNLVTGHRTDYPHVIAHLWPDGMVRQTLLLGLVWAHGCLGLHQWLRLAAGYRRIVPLLAVAALLLPLAATLGIAVQGQFMDRDLAAAERFGAPDLARFWEARPTPEAVSALRAPVLAVIYAAAAGALALGGWRIAAAWRARRIVVTYSTGQSVRAAEGQTLLDISRSARIPHVAVCGGRGRCSTCRVLVTQGGQNLDPPGPSEAATLAAIAAPPGVRLACQARPRGDVAITRILRPRGREAAAAQMGDPDLAGIEREVAILFVDVRGFTSLSERKFAFDVVYILNRFFEAAGRPVIAHGGWIGGYAGDGLLALFTHPDGIDAACRAAYAAAADIDRAVDGLNRQIAAELPVPLRVAMGLHAGPLVLGRLGFGESLSVSVIGPAVNIASRLESLAKAAEVQLAASAETARRAGLDAAGLRAERVQIRGSSALDILYVERAGALAGRLPSA